MRAADVLVRQWRQEHHRPERQEGAGSSALSPVWPNHRRTSRQHEMTVARGMGGGSVQGSCAAGKGDVGEGFLNFTD